MLIPLVVGVSGIALTVVMHAVVTSCVANLLRKYVPIWRKKMGDHARPLVLVVTAAIFSIKHFADICIWAVAYHLLNADQFEDYENALYFSSVTYTALGYGDVVLSGHWRIMCGIQAMNGILLFGWTSALLFWIVQIMWREKTNSSIS